MRAKMDLAAGQLCEAFAPRNEGIRICGQGGSKETGPVWGKKKRPARAPAEFAYACSYSEKIRKISSTISTILSIPSTVRCSYGP